MIALLQRVRHAGVSVDGNMLAEIDRGILLLIGVEKNDNATRADRLVERFLGYRVFPDKEGKMNLSVRDIQGAVLLVPQFTLAADTRKGTRPSFSSAAPPADGQRLFDHVVKRTQQQHQHVSCGKFAADMQVSLVNDGPVTFWLQT